MKPVLLETIQLHRFVPTKNKKHFFPSTLRPLIPGDLCCLVPVLFLLSLLSFPRCAGLCGYSGLWGVSALRAPLDPGYQSFIHSLISWSRSSIGLAPCGRERVQVPAGLLSQHRTQPGYTPAHTQKKSQHGGRWTHMSSFFFFLPPAPTK